METLLFARLTPLLVLNALPSAALVAEDALQRSLAGAGCVPGEGKEACYPRGDPASEDTGQEKGGSGRGGWLVEERQGSLEAIRGLLLERTERVHEYSQVTTHSRLYWSGQNHFQEIVEVRTSLSLCLPCGLCRLASI